MRLRLRPFPVDLAGVVSGWATTEEEVVMWCGRPAAPVPPGQINAWAREDGVQPFGLYTGERLVAYGELWVDDGEAGVELARLIVAPGGSVHPLRCSVMNCYALDRISQSAVEAEAVDCEPSRIAGWARV